MVLPGAALAAPELSIVGTSPSPVDIYETQSLEAEFEFENLGDTGASAATVVVTVTDTLDDVSIEKDSGTPSSVARPLPIPDRRR